MTVVENPWLGTTGQEPYVLPEDKPAVDRWNRSLTRDDPRRIELHVLPEPAMGLHDSPVVVLLANPGSTPADRLIPREWVTRG